MNGSGAVTIATSNSYTGGTTINAGKLKIANAAALGGPTAMSTYGTFTINGGTIDNTSGGPLTLPNYPIAWNAGFVFPGSNPLNLGAGAVTLGNSAATVNLSGSTLTLGGPIGDNGLGYGFTQNGAGVLASWPAAAPIRARPWSTAARSASATGPRAQRHQRRDPGRQHGPGLQSQRFRDLRPDHQRIGRPGPNGRRRARRSPTATTTMRATRRLPAARLLWALLWPSRTARST